MRNGYYIKLAFDNIRKNAKIYIPYIITCVLTAAMIYIINSLALSPDYQYLKRGSRSLPKIMQFGSYVTMIFAFIFLFYTNSFIMKRRRKEFGLLNILGMGKRHIAKLLLIETFYISMLTVTVGIGIGILFDKLTFLALTSLIGESVTFGFRLSPEAVFITILFMFFCFFCIYLNMLRQIHLSKPVELLSGSRSGEKEPKTKVIMTILGFGLIGLGYTISITTKEPQKHADLFFIAIIAVIIGTYFLFIAGSVALLKILKKNKRFYYKVNHFSAVSGLIYRMKRNAVGLASVCILSTMVLVMMSSTTAMIVGKNDLVYRMHPGDANLYVYSYNDACTAYELMSKKMKFESIGIEADMQIMAKGDVSDPVAIYEPLEADNELFYYDCILLSEYNRYYNYNLMLNEGEVMLLGPDRKLDLSEINLFGVKFNVVNGEYETTDEYHLSNYYTLIFRNIEDFNSVSSALNAELNKKVSLSYKLIFKYDTSRSESGDEQFEQAFMDIYDLDETFEDAAYYTLLSNDKDEATEFIGGLFFLGIFLGTLFIMETILIIYYKQITEGYEDQKGFEIMQNVGMSRAEVKKTIRSQILIVFFLPLIFAGAHVLFAHPMLSRLMTKLDFANMSLFNECVFATIGLFTVFYSVIYLITARVYYKIVRK